MQISILSPDLSSNAMARTCPIAKVLSQEYEIQMIGFDHGDGFFTPYEDEFDPITFDVGETPISLARNIHYAEQEITGDVCYAFRPMVGSLGVGLLHKHRTGTPVILDIEDIVRFEQRPWYQQLYNSIVFSASPTSGAYATVMHMLLDEVDQVTVTAEFLQDRYGGEVLPYGPDGDKFNPSSVSPNNTVDEEYEDVSTIVFVGTIRPHKGLDVLATAVSKTRHEVQLIIAGYDPHEMIPELRDLSGDRIDFHGAIRHDLVPGYLAAADLVAVPQRATPYTQAQVPNKIFEAMAMGRPVVASDVSDISTILSDCGWIVTPGDSDELAEVIDEILANSVVAEERGQCLRDRYLDKYSWEVLSSQLCDIIGSLVGE